MEEIILVINSCARSVYTAPPTDSLAPPPSNRLESVGVAEGILVVTD